MTGDGVDEDGFSKSPTEGDWSMSLPVPTSDLDWTKRKLKSDSTRVTARAVGEEMKGEKAAAARSEASINLQEFMKS